MRQKNKTKRRSPKTGYGNDSVQIGPYRGGQNSHVSAIT
jgi:hypothetical protein